MECHAQTILHPYSSVVIFSMRHVNIRRITLAVLVVNVMVSAHLCPVLGWLAGSHTSIGIHSECPLFIHNIKQMTSSTDSQVWLSHELGSLLCSLLQDSSLILLDNLHYWMKALLTPTFLTQCWPTLPKHSWNLIKTSRNSSSFGWNFTRL